MSTLVRRDHDSVLRPSLRRLRHRRRDRVRHLLAADAGACARSPSGYRREARRRGLPEAIGAVLAAARRLLRIPGPEPERTRHAGTDFVDRHPRRAGDGRHPLALGGGLALIDDSGMNRIPENIRNDEWWLATLGRTIVWARLRVRD